MSRRVTFERLEVGDDLPGVVAEERAAGDPEEGAEEEPARVAAEGALPHHLDPAATLGWRRGELPAAARMGVDVGAGHRRSDPAGLGPVVMASFPVDADASWGAFGRVGGRLAELVDGEVLGADGRPHQYAVRAEVVGGI